MDHHELHRAVSVLSVAELAELMDGARAHGATVLEVDVSRAVDKGTLLAAIVGELGPGAPAARWNWDGLRDLLWQRLHDAEGGEAVLVLSGVQGVDLQTLVDTTVLLLDLVQSVAPTRLWAVLGTDR